MSRKPKPNYVEPTPRGKLEQAHELLREGLISAVEARRLIEAEDDWGLRTPFEKERLASFTIPIKAQNITNERSHYHEKAKRVAAQKRAVRYRCPPWTHGPLLVVKLTQVSPRMLDDDGSVAALKHVRDAVASWLRMDDASPLIKFEYAQRKGEASVEVEVRRA